MKKILFLILTLVSTSAFSWCNTTSGIPQQRIVAGLPGTAYGDHWYEINNDTDQYHEYDVCYKTRFAAYKDFEKSECERVKLQPGQKTGVVYRKQGVDVSYHYKAEGYTDAESVTMIGGECNPTRAADTHYVGKIWVYRNK